MKNLLQWGSEYVVDEEKTYPCSECGKPTHFVEIFYQVPICSKECQKKIDEDFAKWHMEHFEETESIF